MTDMSTNDVGATPTGPILFVYDGTALAGIAIDRAARELATGRDALVLCVWQPADVGFESVNKRHFDADAANEVHQAAEETAAFGASLAQKAGFRAQSLAVEAAPTWKGIVQTADERHASLIVIGAHRYKGLVGHLLGSVASAVISHAACSVLVVHQES
jgi:nucleotide-binding universal stress UspA family protein